MSKAKPYIVIAEDEKAYGRIYVNKLTNEGFEVTLVEKGDEVLPALLKRKPQLLVLDLIMPGMDGFAILEKIRQNPELRDLRVLVASNLSQDIDKVKVAKFDIFGYFVKSDLSITEVTERIVQALPE